MVARDALERAWRIAHDHYLWLANLTGLRGEALLAAGQAKGDVNPQRRLGRRLPPEWPVATRKAVVHLLAGTPRRPGLLAWWASTPVEEVPVAVRSRWQGLVIVIDPAVAGMTDSDRRLVREQAQRWQPAPPMPAVCDQGIAVEEAAVLSRSVLAASAAAGIVLVVALAVLGGAGMGRDQPPPAAGTRR